LFEFRKAIRFTTKKVYLRISGVLFRSVLWEESLFSVEVRKVLDNQPKDSGVVCYLLTEGLLVIKGDYQGTTSFLNVISKDVSTPQLNFRLQSITIVYVLQPAIVTVDTFCEIATARFPLFGSRRLSPHTDTRTSSRQRRRDHAKVDGTHSAEGTGIRLETA
jgi:hypothetical protein